MAKEVKVLGSWSCPYAHQVELALRLKGVPFDRVEEDLWRKNPTKLERNLIVPIFKKDVPVLVHNGKPVAEALVILEYIEDTWGGYPLLPKDPLEKAHARSLARFIADKFIPNFRMACWCEGGEQKKGIGETVANLSILEVRLGGRRFFGGDSIGLEDIAANYIAIWAGVVQEVNGVTLIDEESHPGLVRWSEEFLTSDVVKESLPDKGRLTATYAAHRIFLVNSDHYVNVRDQLYLLSELWSSASQRNNTCDLHIAECVGSSKINPDGEESRRIDWRDNELHGATAV